MIEIRSLCHSFGERTVFNNFDLSLPNRGIVSIMGGSGCGKTTLLNIIAGIIKADAGSIRSVPSDIKVSYMFQEPRLLEWATISENVNFVLGGKKSTLGKVNILLEKLGLKDYSDKYPGELSGGMKQRVSFARAVIFEADVLLLDEPFNGLDRERIKTLTDIITEYSKNHLVILVTHQKEYAEAISERIIVISDVGNSDAVTKE